MPNGVSGIFYYISRWLANYLSYISTGYGIRSRFLIAWASIVVTGSVLVNFCFWDCLNVVGSDGSAEDRDLIAVLYYTVTIPSGIGDLTPASDIGRVIFLGETLSGLFIVALFVHLIIRRALR